MDWIAVSEDVEERNDPAIPTQTIVAWGMMLSVSLLPDIILQYVTGGRPSWLVEARFFVLGGLIFGSFFWTPLFRLRSFIIILAAILLIEFKKGDVNGSTLWQTWFSAPGAGFGRAMFGEQLLRLAGAAIVGLLLFGLRFRPKDFFLAKGELNALAAPVGWLGINKPIGWTKLGVFGGLYISLGTLLFLVIGGRPSPDTLLALLPSLPLVVLLAAMNAFSEEFVFRGALLAPLLAAVGRRQGVLLTAVYFGLAHFYGVPYGPVGVVMASLLGWFLGKCMVETKGIVWPWFIHFLQDVMIFSFMAMGAIVAGGK